MKYRSKTDIIQAVLESARNGATKTKIMYSAYLSYSLLMNYLKLLTESGLLRYEKGKQVYILTEKGFRFLKTSNELSDLISLNP